ncbi:MarR family transcriptional regulator [Salsuginibacillus halophilus]|uniref:MarR family transcriptional regulator n=1 Tax=Salsuginibacillus halophilus TaxID=517424 RepID=A0A2P8HAL9_9BACI|nr:MarR family transcriptional regulator [Salsuginibacillus halophilus]PSL43276.1 MarR family transcriptional regulator [Salsuginibacillus halophilus]
MSNERLNTSELVDQTLFILPHLSKKLFEPIHRNEASELHQTHFHILHLVSEHPMLKISEIAAKLAVKKPNLTPLLNTLTEKGFISRKKDEHDGRVMYITLTETGRRFLDEKKGELQIKVADRLASLSAEDQAKLGRAVADMHEVISKLED